MNAPVNTELVTEVEEFLRDFKTVLADDSYSMTIYEMNQVKNNIDLLVRVKKALETAAQKENALREMLTVADDEDWAHIYPEDIEGILNEDNQG